MNRWLPFVLLPLLAIGAAEQTSPPIVLTPEEAVRQGRELTTQILAFKPDQNATNTGVLRIRDGKGQRTEIPVEADVVITNSGWLSIYTTSNTDRAHFASLTVVHSGGRPNEYIVRNVNAPPDDTNSFHKVTGDQVMKPFADSDFWIADLGLEFFQWPEQRLLRKEIRRGQSCYVLESTNPHPTPGSYARVLSWIDIDTVRESGGPAVVFATAYDQKGKALKDFAPKALKKVQGEWQLQEMEMDNRQTGSRSWFEFDLSSQTR